MIATWPRRLGHYPLARVERAAADSDLELMRGAGEAGFEELVARYHGPMLRLAMGQVRDRELAEDLVQEAWLQALASLDRFEGRSTFRTWLFGILLNLARARRRKESRLRPFTSLFRRAEGEPGPVVDADRFNREGAWTTLPDRWDALPEQRLLNQEALERVAAAIDALPAPLREVITLRDVAGWSSDEVGSLLGISPVNQRVRLHRARGAVRRALEDYLR